MARATIDYGIDLGTTNSAVAVMNGRSVEVIRNNEGFEYTPSAVWIDKRGSLLVGRDAREHLDDDNENAFSEFKLQMGRPKTYQFARSGRTLKPEELSAEVLRALKTDVRQRTGEDLQHSVITVPADFNTPESQATERAAAMAGINQVLLVQEPVAAAMAYGFDTNSDNVYWLVYDFGGGTFDAAVIKVQDGMIQVVNHAGDKQLGGKLIDWAIVEQLLVPAVTASFERQFPDFRRGNLRWQANIAKLKLAAEDAKIKVSRLESAPIYLDLRDERGQDVEFEFILERKDVELLAAPFLLRSINLCKQALQEKRLTVDNLEKVLLVGGPTLSPYFRDHLSDKRDGLGVTLEFGLDPLTVVARGAAVFAGAKGRTGATTVVGQGVFKVVFPDWQFRGNDMEPQIVGRVEAAQGLTLPPGCNVEIINRSAHATARTGKIPVATNGAFMATLWAESSEINRYQLELTDRAGRQLAVVTEPDQLTYDVGIAPPAAPAAHTIGIQTANNEMAVFIAKGTPLPARQRRTDLVSAFAVTRGQDSDVIRVPVMEGEHPRADRNRRIGVLTISGRQIRRDVPAGSEIEVTIERDESGVIHTRAYIPILDEEYEEVMKIGGIKSPPPAKMRESLKNEQQRLTDARRSADQTRDATAQTELQKIEAEKIVQDVESLLGAADVDDDAANKCEQRILDLQAALDKVEEALRWPDLVKRANEQIDNAWSIVNEAGNPDDKRIMQQHESDIRAAVRSQQPDVLNRCLGELGKMILGILDRTGALQVYLFQWLMEQKAKMRDSRRVQQLEQEGLRAIQNNQVDRLRAVVRELQGLLPNEIRAQSEQIEGTLLQKGYAG